MSAASYPRASCISRIGGGRVGEKKTNNLRGGPFPVPDSVLRVLAVQFIQLVFFFFFLFSWHTGGWVWWGGVGGCVGGWVGGWCGTTNQPPAIPVLRVCFRQGQVIQRSSGAGVVRGALDVNKKNNKTKNPQSKKKKKKKHKNKKKNPTKHPP